MTPFPGLRLRRFGKPLTTLRRLGADVVHQGRPWSLPREDRLLLVTAYWRTDLTLRQLAPLFDVSKSTAAESSTTSAPCSHSSPRNLFAKDAVLIVDGSLVPTLDRTITEWSKNHRYSTNHQVAIDTDTGLVVVVGRPLAGYRNGCKAWEESGAKAPVGKTTTIADGGYPGIGLVIPHRRQRSRSELPDWEEEHNKSHRQVRARVELTAGPGREPTAVRRRRPRFRGLPLTGEGPRDRAYVLLIRAGGRTDPFAPGCRAAPSTPVRAHVPPEQLGNSAV
ncbi:hypothetical protein GCM10017667_69870 [Streptomyces filamentosus]|uniref:Transposase n=1 Tax=Streptomyces filamentosus TaxID=67294 RepID=A0A919ERD1_STRFL|nr:hypothetical protein GCM10017667_69870 [Streptomyces filamentosus]